MKSVKWIKDMIEEHKYSIYITNVSLRNYKDLYPNDDGRCKKYEQYAEKWNRESEIIIDTLKQILE